MDMSSSSWATASPAVSVALRLEEHRKACSEASAITDDALKILETTRQNLTLERNRLEERQHSLQQRRDELATSNGGTEASSGDRMKLNVGGARITALRETLTQFPDSKLAALFSGRWDQKLQRDKKGRIFLDINPVCFKKILDFHKLLKLSSPGDPPPLPSVPKELRDSYVRLVQLFGLEVPLHLEMREQSPPLDSAILTAELAHASGTPIATMTQRLYEWLCAADPADPSVPSVPRAELVYRASSQGWAVPAFNTTIRNKGPTLVLIKSETGHVFGGYAALPWNANALWMAAPESFLFALHSASGLPPTRMPLKSNNESQALYMNSQMAVFGGGHDLVLGMSSGKRQTGGNLMDGSSNVGAGSYYCPPGHDGRKLLTGESAFKAVEVEVFRITHDNDILQPRWASPPPSPQTPGGASAAPASGPATVIPSSSSAKAAESSAEVHASPPIDAQLGNLIERCLQREREELSKAHEAVDALELAFEEEAAFAHFFTGEAKDVIDLDVSGELVSVKRSTLMRCPTSALARQFDDTVWSQQGQSDGLGSGDADADDDGDDAIFIEQPTYSFCKVIDQLRLISIMSEGSPPAPPSIAQHERETFERVVRYYFPGVEDFILNSKLDGIPN